jgi:hypothetical protein
MSSVANEQRAVSDTVGQQRFSSTRSDRLNSKSPGCTTGALDEN